MFHSLAAVLHELHPQADHIAMRAHAANAVTPENAPDVLMDMSAQMPKTLETPMDVSNAPGHGTFSPEILWNDSKGSREAMSTGLKRAIATQGNHLWGDATLAALVEISMNVNIILLAADSGTRMPPTPKEFMFARTMFRRWVENVFAARPDLAAGSKEEVFASMVAMGLTWDRALSLSRAEVGSERGGWLRGRSQPVGSIRELCTNPNSGNLTRKNYLDSRPTVIIWNRSNVHWVPIGVGPFSETLIKPNTPLRKFVDNLIK
jgi:hypothetical protein